MADPAGWIARRFASADTLASDVADWLRCELVTQPEWPRVSGTLEPELKSIARTFAAVTLTTSKETSLQIGWPLTVAALAPAHQAEWNRMLLGLRPARLVPLDRFRFAGERGGTDASSSIRVTIRDALSAKATKRAATNRRPMPE